MNLNRVRKEKRQREHDFKVARLIIVSTMAYLADRCEWEEEHLQDYMDSLEEVLKYIDKSPESLDQMIHNLEEDYNIKLRDV